MKEFLHYWKRYSILLILLLISFTGILAQDQPSFEFKIQIHEKEEVSDPNTWGVYVKPTGGFVDGTNTTLTASGQVTILMENTPTDSIENIQSVNGAWQDVAEYGKFRDNAVAHAYFFVGLIDEGDGIPLENDQETLLFTFQTTQECPDTLGLFNNGGDPNQATFDALRLNPGMDLAVINKSTGVIHNWGGNYAPSSFSCEDCDMDGIPNGIEDSNGDGMFTPPIAGVAQDSSDMCDACDPLGIKNFTAELTGGDTTAICIDSRNTYQAGLVVTTTGGVAPFTLYLNAASASDADGVVIRTIQESGDTFYVAPTETTTYTLDSIVDVLGCRLEHMDSLKGEVVVTVEGPLEFTAGGNNLDEVTSCTLDTLRIGIEVENGTGRQEDIIYQWQSSPDGITFTDVINGTPYSNANTDTLVISNPDGLNDMRYRAIISSAACDQLDMVSDTATLRVEGPFVINNSPTTETICGDVASHTIVASTDNLGSGTISRKWQVQDGTGWKYIEDIVNGSGVVGEVVYADMDTDILTIEPDPATTDANLSGLNEYWYRLEISGTGGYCNEIFTDSAQLFVEGPLLHPDNKYPESTETCAGETACFGVEIANPGGGTVEYQWQYKTADPSSVWADLANGGPNGYSGVRSDTMCIADAVGLNGYRYQVKINLGECAEIETSNITGEEPDTLFVSEPISFDLQPQSEAICGGNSTTFSVEITDNGETGFTQQWQMSKDTGISWVDVVDDAIFSGAMTDDLSVNTMPITAVDDLDTLNGRLFRIAVTSANCLTEVFSREAELRLHVIDTANVVDPRDTTVCSGEPAYFVVDVPYNRDTQEIVYQWQIQHPISMVAIDLDDVGDYNGVKTPRFSISDVNGFNGMKFRASISTNKCAVFNTEWATLTVEGPFIFGADNDGHPQDTTICYGTPVTFEANPVIDQTTKDPFGNDNAGTGTLTYNWVFNPFGEYNNPADVDTATWALAGGATGTDGTTLTINNTETLEGFAFWLEVTSAECQDNPTKSLPAILHIDGPLRVVLDPLPASNCADEGAVFAANIDNDGYGGEQSIVYRWRERDAGGTWRDIDNGGVYNGATTDTLSIDVLYGLNNFQYALYASTIDGCSEIYTDTVSLEQVGPIDVTKDPIDIDTCSGQGGYFAATVIDSITLDDTNLVYNWQVSSNGGLDWANISGTTTPLVYTDQNTDTLKVSDVTGLNGYRYRLAVTFDPLHGTCDTVFSQAARIRAEGPIMYEDIADLGTICQNLGTTINARIDVANTGPGVPQLQWEYRVNASENFAILTNDSIYDATTTNQLFIDSVLYIDGYQYRLTGTTEKCKVTDTYFYSDTITIAIQSDTLAMCDFDLDGIPNGDNYGDPDNPLFDFDDDNDGLQDTIEIYITNSGIDSLSAFDSHTPIQGDTEKTKINDSEKDSDKDTINNGEETDDDDGDGDADDQDVFNGDPVDPCDPILSPACIGIALDVRVKLQGAMLGQAAGDLMRDDLRTNPDGSLLPTTEPYSSMYIKKLGQNTPELAFKHVDDHQNEENGKLKGGGEIADATLLSKQASDDNDIVDWVFVELRSGIQLDSVIATRSALLQRDGDVRDTDEATAEDVAKGWVDAAGYKLLTFDSTLAGPYYVSVRHRNHLGVMTNEAGELSPKVAKIDFSDPQTNALGVHPQKMLLSGTDSLEQQMWAGDLNSDGKVIYQGAQNDVYEMFWNVFKADGNDDGENGDPLDNFILTDYKRSDYNLDGKTIYQGPQNDRQMLIFNTILSFPDNQEHLLANYVILEQLP